MRADIHRALTEPWLALPKKIALYGVLWLVGAIVLTGLKILTDPHMRGMSPFAMDVVAVAAFFLGFVLTMVYVVWWWIGHWLTKWETSKHTTELKNYTDRG